MQSGENYLILENHKNFELIWLLQAFPLQRLWKSLQTGSASESSRAATHRRETIWVWCLWQRVPTEGNCWPTHAHSHTGKVQNQDQYYIYYFLSWDLMLALCPAATRVLLRRQALTTTQSLIRQDGWAMPSSNNKRSKRRNPFWLRWEPHH